MLDLGSLSVAARIAYAKTLAHSIAAGVEPHVAEQIAREALVKAGLVAVTKSRGEPARVSKRIEAKPAPTDAELGAAFLGLYEIAKTANPRESVGSIHSRLAKEHPIAARAYADHITGR